MHIRIVCPAPPGSLYGNRTTALRWARILREIGHRVAITGDYRDEACDLLIALHARRSADGVFRFRKRHPELPLIVALTGTDLYRDLQLYKTPRRVLQLADRIVVLQPLGIRELAPAMRKKARVIYQSAERFCRPHEVSHEFFDICVIGHLRAVKDPFRAAKAARLLPSTSRIRILHAGDARDSRMAQIARAEEARNPRYRWLGPLSRSRTRQLMAGSRLMVLSSRMEGGANVISEALVDGTPVIASRIPGSLGLMGEDYPGYFEPGDTHGLALLLERAESHPRFYRSLAAHCRKMAYRFRPSRERSAWKSLLAELSTAHTRK